MTRLFLKRLYYSSRKNPLKIIDIEFPEFLDIGQILVKIHYSGICGSQIGEIDGVKGIDKYLPHLLGHEGVATVLEVGPRVKNIAIGDKVVIHWRPGKGINAKTPTYKYKGGKINAGWATTFNEFAIVSENRVTKINKKYDMKIAPLFGCAITTGFGVVENNAKLKKGESVVIYGSGGIGLNMIQAASIKKSYPIVAVDIFQNRLDLAKKCGATHTIKSSNFKSIKKQFH